MIYGVIFIAVAFLCYIANILLLKFYLDKNAPSLLEIDANLPKPKKNEEYLWEKTAGTGIVPKWVSIIGLMSLPTFVVGIIMVLIGFFK